jgi:AcrR family transcriptional regulator
MELSKPSQEERLIEAMIATAARYGYGETSVARVVAHAGVSRATFYQHFADKEACFLAAYREVAQRVAVELKFAGESRQAGGRPREILRRLLEGADREPASARIVLLESLAAGPVVRVEHEKLRRAMEAAMETYLDEAAVDGMQLEIPARSLLGGLGNVVAMRVFRGETGRLIGLLDDLEAWLRSYAMPAGRRRHQGDWTAMGRELWSPVEPERSVLDERLPRGRAALSPAVVASEQRQRVLAAVALLAREKGYTAMTVADIVATAGITREAFYEQFRSKEDAFLATQAYALQTSVSRSAGSFFGEESWPDRVWNGVMALLHYFGSVPHLAALDVVESYAAGSASIQRSFEARMAFTLFLEDGYRQRPEAEVMPRLCSEAIAGAALEPLRHQTVADRADQALELAPQIVYIALAPFMGPAEALELVESKCAAASSAPPARRPRERPRAG